MKPRTVLAGVILLLAGFAAGIVCAPWLIHGSHDIGVIGGADGPTSILVDGKEFGVIGSADGSIGEAVLQSPNGSGSASLPQLPALNQGDNYILLSNAYCVLQALREQDYNSLAALVHPQLGVTFTPYSTVDPEMDHTLTQEQVRKLEQDSTVYTWGLHAARGDLMQMTIQEYFQRYVFDADYFKAPAIGIDRIVVGGNALENVTTAYPDCRFVDFCYPASSEGADWCSLKLVFQALGDRWYLVGAVHGEWTT